MELQTLDDLPVHQIREIPGAERQVKQALPRMAEFPHGSGPVGAARRNPGAPNRGFP